MKQLYVINLILIFAYYRKCHFNRLHLTISLFLLLLLFNLGINYSVHHFHFILLICLYLNKVSSELCVFTVPWLVVTSNIEIGCPVNHFYI
jgi:hypothetical protein